jgi:hypothetical protein
VSLGHRGRGHRRRLERTEGVTDVHAEFGLDGPLGGTGRVGGHIRLQLSKLSRDVVADQVRVEAQHLAKLDPGGAKLTQSSAEPLPRAQGSEIWIRDPGNERGAKSGVEDGCGVIGQPSEPVPGEDVSNLLDAILVMEEHTSDVV